MNLIPLLKHLNLVKKQGKLKIMLIILIQISVNIQSKIQNDSDKLITESYLDYNNVININKRNLLLIWKKKMIKLIC